MSQTRLKLFTPECRPDPEMIIDCNTENEELSYCNTPTNSRYPWSFDFNTENEWLTSNRTIDLDVTLDDYTQAVQTLLKLADMHCGGSSAAAQLLLNLYNGWNYHTNLIDLCSIDDIYLSAAITAILGRIKLSLEPHEVIPDGDRIFNQLHDDWPELHIRNRYANA